MPAVLKCMAHAEVPWRPTGCTTPAPASHHLDTRAPLCTGCGLACVGLLFEYLGMLRAAGPQRWAYDELAAMAQMRFRFQVRACVRVLPLPPPH